MELRIKNNPKSKITNPRSKSRYSKVKAKIQGKSN